MDRRYILIFSLLLVSILAYSQSFRKEQLDYGESGVVAHLNGGNFMEGDKRPTPKLLFGVRMGYDFLI